VKSREIRHNNLHQEEEICREEIEVQRRADSVHLAPGGDGYLGGRGAAPQAARVRKPPVETHGSRPEPRQADAAGCPFKKIIKPALKRRLVDSLDLAYRVGVRRACAVLEFSRTSYYYRSIKFDDPALRHRIREIAQARVRYGYQRIQVLLRREGWKVNHKRVYRIYCEEGLHLRRKRPKR